FDDLCEVKNVAKGRMYLEINGTMRHVGRTGSFMPVRQDGGILWRIDGEKQHRVTGTKDYIWVDREIAAYRESRGELYTDMDYFEHLKADAVKAIEKYISFDEFVKD